MWGTVVRRRAGREPPERGGRHMFVTNPASLNDVLVPPQIAIRGGPGAWFGWPDAPALGALREAWPDAATPAGQRRRAAEIRLRFFRDVTDVPLGRFYQPAAFGKRLAGTRPGRPVRHAVRFV